MYYVINADGEGYFSDTPDVPAGYQVFTMSEDQGLVPYTPPASVFGPAIQEPAPTIQEPAPVADPIAALVDPIAAPVEPAPVADPIAALVDPIAAPVEPAPVNNPIYDNLYVVNADGEGYQYNAEAGALPEGSQLYAMSEEQGLVPVDNRLATDANIQYGEPGSLGYELATLGGMGSNGAFDSAGFTNPDSVAAFLEPYVPAGTDLSGAIQDAWQQQQDQFGYWSGADDPGQTALKILAQVDDPWAQQATQAIASSPEFAQSQYAGTAALNYDPDAGTFYGVPGPIASAALGMALGPMGLDFGAMLGGGVLGGAGTGALSSAIMGGNPVMGALTGSIAPGLGEMGLPSQYIPLASSLAGAAINGGDLTQGLIGGIGGTLSQLANSPQYTYTAEDTNYPSVFDETDAGMAEAYANPYLSPDLFTQQPTQEQPSFTATVVPDPQPDNYGWTGPDWSQQVTIPEGYYYNEDYGRVLPNGYTINPATGEPINVQDYDYNEDTGQFTLKQAPTFPQEQADFPIYQPEPIYTPPESSYTQPPLPEEQGNFPIYQPEPTYTQPTFPEEQADYPIYQPELPQEQADFPIYQPQTTQQETGASMPDYSYFDNDYDPDAFSPDVSGSWGGSAAEDADLGALFAANGGVIPQGTGLLGNTYGTATGGNTSAGIGGLITSALKNFFGGGGSGGTWNPATGSFTGGGGNNMNMLLPLLGGLLGYASGGSKPAGNTTTTQDVPDWQKPYITGMLDSAKNVYNAAETNNGFLNNARTQLNSTISGDYLNSNPANQSFQQMAGYTNPYEGLLAPTATGAFLNSNPYLDATYDRAARNMTDQYKYATMPSLSRQFGHMQAFGGNSGYQQSMGLAERGLATGLGDLATGIYGNNYANERGMMQNAQTGLLGSANATQGIRAAGASGLAGNFNTARGQQLAASTTAPGFSSEYTANAFAPINNYSNLVGRSFGSQTQQPYYSNPTGGALSGALAGYSLSNLFGK